jgi:hypothetical protein
MLKFIDDTEIGMFGLDEIFADLYSEDRPANDETVEEIMDRLEAQKNYIPSSASARRAYAYALLKEYRKYLRSRADNDR